LPSEFPRYAATAHGCGELLPEALFDDGFPRDEGEAHAVVEHGIAAAGKHDVAAVDAGHALAVGGRAVFQSGFGGDVFGGLRQFFVTQCRQKIAGEDDALAALVGQALFDQKIGALLHGVFDFAAESQIAQALAAVDELLVKPGCADDAGLALDGKVGFQLDRHAAQALRVVLTATLGQVGGDSPYAIGDALDDTSATQGFQSAYVGGDDFLRGAVWGGLSLRDGEVVVCAVQAVFCQCGDGFARIF